jgi:hypothetical protein
VSATRVRRAFRASPVRTAVATWTAIVDVLAPEGAPGREQLNSLSGIAASLIASDAWTRTPAVVAGTGPQLRIYCLHGEDAIVGDDANEDALAWSPTDADWSIEFPCPPEDLTWVQAALADSAAPATVVDCTQGRSTSSREASTAPVNAVDAEAFLRG